MLSHRLYMIGHWQELCYLPTWPFFTGGPGKIPFPVPYHHFDWPLLSNSGDDHDDSVKPQPRCIQRTELVPQTPVSAYKDSLIGLKSGGKVGMVD